MSEPTKTCSRCRLEKPHRDFYFNRGRQQPAAYCKPCVKDKAVEWQKANPDKKKASDALKAAKQRELLAQDTPEAAALRAKLREREAAWRAANPEKAAEAAARYRAANPEKMLERSRKWRADNPDKVRVSQQKYHATEEWKAKHRETERERRKKVSVIVAEAYRAYVRAGGTPVPLNKRLNADEWRRLVSTFGALCAYCGAEDPAEVDHVVPLSKGGLHVKGNVLPACRQCNSQKRTRSFGEFCVERQIPAEQQDRILETAGASI